MNSLTICICTFDRVKYLRKALESLSKQLDKNFTVLIIDNNSSTKISSQINDFNSELDITTIIEKKQGISNARNRGLDECKTHNLAFIDDDVILPELWVQNINSILNSKPKSVGVIGGPISIMWESTRPIWMSKKLESFLGRYSNVKKKKYLKYYELFNGINMIFRMSAIKKKNRFRKELGFKGEEILPGEDSDFQIRLKGKYKFYYSDELQVHHFAKTSCLNKKWFMERAKMGGIANSSLLKYKLWFIPILLNQILILIKCQISNKNKFEKKIFRIYSLSFWESVFNYISIKLSNIFSK